MSRGFQVLVGFGHSPERLLGWFILLLVFAVTVCTLTPSNSSNWRRSSASTANAATKAPGTQVSASDDLASLDRTLFAVDAAVPVLDLGQERQYSVRGFFLSGWYVVTVTLSWLFGILLAAALGKRLVRE